MHDEKARIQAIISSPHAKGREALAQHLAFSTDMPTEQAVAMLQAAPAATSSPAAPRAAIPPVAQRSADAAIAGALSVQSAPGAPGAQGGDHASMWKRAVAKAAAPVIEQRKQLGLE